MKSSMVSESSSSWAGSVPPPPPAPLSLRIEVAKGALDLSVTAASSEKIVVTPPRHQSSRGSAGGRGHIDPFTPPEVAVPPRSSHHRPTGEAGSPQSGVSSTNTEQARHDRLPRYDPVSAVPADKRFSSRVLNDSMQSAESYISPPSAPTRGGVLQRSPLWTEEEDDSSGFVEEVDHSKNDANVSALTELPFDDGSSTTSTLSELRRAKHALSSSEDEEEDEVSAGSGSISSQGTSVSSKASSHQERLSGDQSGSIHSASSLATGSSLRSSTSSASTATSASSASSSSSSSASMLSYLDSAQKPARPDAAAALPGVTITIAGSAGAHVPTVPLTRTFSPSHSLESDSVSMLSITSDHPHEALQRHAAEGGSMLDSFAALTHQELQDVLDDLSDADEEHGDITRSPLQPQARTSTSQKYQDYSHTYPQQQQLVPQPESVDRSHSTQSSNSREVSPDASDYASMFGSDDEEEEEEDKKNSKGALRSFPLPHTIDRIVEEEEEEENSQAESVQSASTGELFDRWQQLYQGSLHLGTEARALRSEHLSAYNATTSSIALSETEEESFLSQDMTSPPRRTTTAAAAVSASPLNVLVFPQQERERTDERMEFSKSTLYESDLRSSHSGSSMSRSASPTGSDADSRSSDSLSPRKRTNKSSAPLAASSSQQSRSVAHSSTVSTYATTTSTTRTTSVDVRASYEHNSRATALMSELDKLSLDWQEKQAFYANPSSSKQASAPAPAPAPAVGATPPRAPGSSRAAVPQPAQPPHYASPSWLTRRGAGEGTTTTTGPGLAGAINLSAGMASTSLSSLSAVNSPPEETTGATTRDVAAARDVYTGRLFVHGESRAAYPVTAAHLPDLAARLELEDSMNSSLLSSDIGAEDVPSGLSAGARNTTYSHSTYSAYSSEGEDEEEVENRSLEELLNSQAGSATRGRIQSEIAAMRNRLLASVGGSSSPPFTVAPPVAAPTTTQQGEEGIRTSSNVRVDNSSLSRTQATTAAIAVPAASSSSRSLGSHSQRGVASIDAGAALWHSSGEDTYSSSRYYSAGSSEARHSSAAATKVSTTSTSGSGSGSSSMHTADTSSVDAAAATRHQAVDGSLRSTTRNVTTTHTAVASSTMHSSHYTSSSNYRFVSHTTGGSGSSAVVASPGLRDDSGRPGAYTFTGQRSEAHTYPATEGDNPSSPANTSSTSAAEGFLLAQEQQLNSPTTPASVSRLSEYAMLSQHTLHTSRGSPGSDSNSPPQWRQPSSREGDRRDGPGKEEDESFEFTRHAANNTSSTSDNSSTFSEYMRHFPSNR